MIIYKLIQLVFQLFGLDSSDNESKRKDRATHIVINTSNSCKVPSSSDHFSFKRIYEDTEIL